LHGFSDSAQVDERRADDDRLPERIKPIERAVFW
jgi:hypothetical protein